MCLFCFSKEPLTEHELTKGDYARAYGKFANGDTSKYHVTLCNTPCAEPGCWCGSMLCCCLSQMIMRKRVLNHVKPGSGWSDYKCCQGYFGGCCCCQPGKCGEKACPVPCLCLEIFLCPGPAASATSMVIREQYNLGLDHDDVRLIRCNNVLYAISCILQILAICIPGDALDCASGCARCMSDTVFCCTMGCMLGQAHHEMKYRDHQEAPSAQNMER